VKRPKSSHAAESPRCERRTVWLTSDNWRRIRAHAAAQGIPPATALHRIVLAGIQAIEENRHGPLVEIEEALERVRRLLHRIGPAIVGLPHLLAYWATRDAEGVTADGLVAEFTANAQTVWRDALATRSAVAGRQDGQ
jgi:hypothetical protein